MGDFAGVQMSLRLWRRGRGGVGIGRPYVYGLTAFGQAGVERVLDEAEVNS